MVLMKLFAGQHWRRRHREQTDGQGLGRGRRGWAIWREQHRSVYTLTHVKQPMGFAGRLRELKLGFWNDLEVWERVGGGMEVQEGGDICLPMANSS